METENISFNKSEIDDPVIVSVPGIVILPLKFDKVLTSNFN